MMRSNQHQNIFKHPWDADIRDTRKEIVFLAKTMYSLFFLNLLISLFNFFVIIKFLG